MSHLKELLVRILLHYFMSYSNYCNRDHFMHYKFGANAYKFLGRGGVGSSFGVRFLSVFFLGGGV